jgi:hypothetical protein
MGLGFTWAQQLFMVTYALLLVTTGLRLLARMDAKHTSCSRALVTKSLNVLN